MKWRLDFGANTLFLLGHSFFVSGRNDMRLQAHILVISWCGVWFKRHFFASRTIRYCHGCYIQSELEFLLYPPYIKCATDYYSDATTETNPASILSPVNSASTCLWFKTHNQLRLCNWIIIPDWLIWTWSAVLRWTNFDSSSGCFIATVGLAVRRGCCPVRLSFYGLSYLLSEISSTLFLL